MNSPFANESELTKILEKISMQSMSKRPDWMKCVFSNEADSEIKDKVEM